MPFRILIVEDDTFLAAALHDGLNNQAYQISVASDGGHALTLATEQEFDLILTDLLMPHMDGFELIERLRGQGLATPVAVLTNLLRPDTLKRLGDLGVDRQFIKSDTPLKIIREYVAEQAAKQH